MELLAPMSADIGQPDFAAITGSRDDGRRNLPAPAQFLPAIAQACRYGDRCHCVSSAWSSASVSCAGGASKSAIRRRVAAMLCACSSVSTTGIGCQVRRRSRPIGFLEPAAVRTPKDACRVNRLVIAARQHRLCGRKEESYQEHYPDRGGEQG
jgi:hypothetical protein